MIDRDVYRPNIEECLTCWCGSGERDKHTLAQKFTVDGRVCVLDVEGCDAQVGDVHSLDDATWRHLFPHRNFWFATLIVFVNFFILLIGQANLHIYPGVFLL